MNERIIIFTRTRHPPLTHAYISPQPIYMPTFQVSFFFQSSKFGTFFNFSRQSEKRFKYFIVSRIRKCVSLPAVYLFSVYLFKVHNWHPEMGVPPRQHPTKVSVSAIETPNCNVRLQSHFQLLSSLSLFDMLRCDAHAVQCSALFIAFWALLWRTWSLSATNWLETAH